MPGQIQAGEDILAADFINESEKDGTPANDEGRVPKLESDARVSRAFIHPNATEALTAGENITGATTPQACFIMSEARRNLYGLVAAKGEDTESEFETYNSGGGTDRRVGLKFNSGNYTRITGLAWEGQREGGGSHTYELAIYAQDGSGFPTGAAIGTVTFDQSDTYYISTSYANRGHYFVEFGTAVTVSTSTNYVLVLRETTTTGSATQNIHVYAHSTGSNMIYSTNGGSSWSNGNPTHGSASWGAYVLYGHKNLTAGRVYLSDGDDFEKNYFDGFVNETVTAGNSCDLISGQKVENFSALNPGGPVYLSTSPGGITQTRARGKRVGVAHSASTIVLSERTEVSDVYEGDFLMGSALNSAADPIPAVGDCIVETVELYDEDNRISISNKLHEVLFGLFTKSLRSIGPNTVTWLGTVAVKQGEIMAINPDLSGNSYRLDDGDGSNMRVRYLL